MSRTIGISLVTLAVGLAVGALMIWLLGPFGAVDPRIVEGQTTAVSADGEGINIAIEGKETTEAYVIAGAVWQENGLPWQDSLPTCIQPGRTGQAVRLGVVEVAATDEAPGRTVVVWVKCAS